MESRKWAVWRQSWRPAPDGWESSEEELWKDQSTGQAWLKQPSSTHACSHLQGYMDPLQIPNSNIIYICLNYITPAGRLYMCTGWISSYPQAKNTDVCRSSWALYCTLPSEYLNKLLKFPTSFPPAPQTSSCRSYACACIICSSSLQGLHSWLASINFGAVSPQHMM